MSTVSSRHTKRPRNTTSTCLKVLQAAQGALVSSRELKERVGPKWKDAISELRAQGYTIDEVIGASNNRSYKLNEDQPQGIQYLTEPIPVPKTGRQPQTTGVVKDSTILQVNLSAGDIRRIIAASSAIGLSEAGLDELQDSLGRLVALYG